MSTVTPVLKRVGWMGLIWLSSIVGLAIFALIFKAMMWTAGLTT